MSSAYDLDRRYVKEAMSTPLLEAEHEFDLARRWRDEQDEEALHELTTAYIRLVITMAHKFKAYGLPLSDLVQEGNIGLMQAAARFEPDREIRFSTYASWWIRSSMQDYVLKNWSIVRAGATVAHKALFFSLRRLRAQINDLDETMSAENRARIAKDLNVREIDVEHMAGRLSGSDRSLNAPMQADGETQWQDLLPDEGVSPEIEIMSDMDNATRDELLHEVVLTLSDRERQVITRRRLAEDTETLEAIGKDLGVSKERIRQIEQIAMKKLKSALLERVGDIRDFGLLP